MDANTPLHVHIKDGTWRMKYENGATNDFVIKCMHAPSERMASKFDCGVFRILRFRLGARDFRVRRNVLRLIDDAP